MSIDFGRRAGSYDRIRPLDDNWWAIFDLVVREADVRGRRVLDVGCGTGRLSAALAERAAARVWGVDASAEMLDVARERAPAGVGFKQARAEDLPFRDGWFERAVMWLVVHLVDRTAALEEAYRVLAREGRLAVVTFGHDHIGRFWLNRFFPSIERIDRDRFPSEEQLRRELEAAGFADVRLLRVDRPGSLTREQALERIRGHHISTFDLLDPGEIRSGSERAERELPERVDYVQGWVIALACKL